MAQGCQSSRGRTARGFTQENSSPIRTALVQMARSGSATLAPRSGSSNGFATSMGYAGAITIVKDYVLARRQRQRDVLVPLRLTQLARSPATGP